uniref:Cytospin-A n=1 Tax=Echinostoma caproni TaxID=27848 RepID=A0A183AYK5_9TREM
LSPLTERRLINLENQLSSLVAMQLMRLNEPISSRTTPVPPPPAPAASSLQPTTVGSDVFKRDTGGEETDDTGEVDFPSGRRTVTKMLGESVDNRHTRSKSRGSNNEASVKKPMEEQNSAQAIALKTEDTVRVQSIYASNSGSSNRLHPPSLPDENMCRPNCPPPAEDHPPGAPKRPSGTAKPSKSPSPHPTHGKPIFPRRPSSTPGASVELSRTVPSASTGSESSAPVKNQSRRNGQGMKRGDTQDSSRPTTKSNGGPLPNGVSEKTLGQQVLKELDSERFQRKEAEQLCRDLTDRILRLEASGKSWIVHHSYS